MAKYNKVGKFCKPNGYTNVSIMSFFQILNIIVLVVDRKLVILARL